MTLNIYYTYLIIPNFLRILPIESKSMKILHVYKTYFPQTYGGVEQVIHSICNYQKEKNIISDILICSNKNDTYTFDGIDVISMKIHFVISNNSLSLEMINKFLDIQKKYDIIHFHYPYMMNEFLYYLQKINKPYIITYHSDVCRSKLISTLYKFFSYQFLKNAKKVIFTSPNYVDLSYTKTFNINRTVIPLTINSHQTELKYEHISSRIKKLENGYILFLGALRRYKGLKTLIEAAKLSNKNFIVAGSGEEEEKLIKLKKKLNLKNVIFLGQINNFEKHFLLNNCKALVLPSDQISEAFGVVLLEAFVHGKCVITSDLKTGMAYVNQHNITGRVFKKGNPTDLMVQIDFLYNNPLMYEIYCSNAKKIVNSKFSNLQLEKYHTVYSEIILNTSFDSFK